MTRSKLPPTRAHRDDAFAPAAEPTWKEYGIDMGSAEYYRRREEEFDETTQTRKIYKDKTEKLRDWIKGLWFQYCEHVNKEPMSTLKTMPIQVLDNFFHWLLHRRRESLRSASSLQTYWNVFTLMRRSETGIIDVPLLIKSQMHGVRQRLAAEFELRTEKKPKTIVRVEDEVKLLAALWSSNEMSMEHERLRVQLALLIQLAGITGSRPGALISLTYRDLKLSLLRDPEGSEWPRLVVDVTFRNTKSFLGAKAPNTFPIPQVPKEPCLLLCPQISLLGLIFADHAFDGLESPEQLFQLRVTTGLNEQVLPIKDEWAAIPLFRRLKSSVHGLVMSEDVCATDDWLRDKLKTLSDVVGFDLPTGPYSFRRGAGEAFDSSNYVSDSQRNLILQHASSAVFQHNYLSRYITADTQAAFRGLEPQTALMRAASGMSRTIDPRRPTKLSEAEQAQVKQHPEVKLHRRRRDGLKSRIRDKYGPMTRAKGTLIYNKYHAARRDHEKAVKAARKAMLAKSKTIYRKRQPVADIARQLRGDCDPDKAGEPISEDFPTNTRRRRVMNALLTPAPSDPARESERRSKAVAAIASLSRHRDPLVPEVCRPRRMARPVKEASLDAEQEMKSPAFSLECPPTQCIFCLGNHELSMERRTKSFYSRGTLKKHFRNEHLQYHPDNAPIRCPHPMCDLTLEHKMHLQNHAAVIHKTLT
ncbi:hypothetical protein M409DRAFT_30718 [Zasmidium cellare ATCC 36951]|uniref:C2H2-type domain-containing protein n=1 Tax=Zasmidium cellare ATCC 36951 TaxID=1080233 RepID=A0A6A6BVD7_ZASCE|nr:uncharacterized protein M409DRAFT_30718 [Zasmidium cellare ATCC 36951]KAF2158757.1 hypothetical protein M409DRAFT_30718 [Zasmidium cellare ATCC 36951]